MSFSFHKGLITPLFIKEKVYVGVRGFEPPRAFTPPAPEAGPLPGYGSTLRYHCWGQIFETAAFRHVSHLRHGSDDLAFVYRLVCLAMQHNRGFSHQRKLVAVLSQLAQAVFPTMRNSRIF